MRAEDNEAIARLEARVKELEAHGGKMFSSLMATDGDAIELREQVDELRVKLRDVDVHVELVDQMHDKRLKELET